MRGTPGTATLAIPVPQPRRWQYVRRLFTKPRAIVSAGFVVLVAIACFTSPWWVPYDPIAQDLTAILQGPSAAHWLGTDSLGRDVFSRLMVGGGTTLLGAGTALVVVGVVGPLIGLVAGYYDGWVDRTITWFVTIVLALPTVIILLTVLAVFTNNMTVAMIAFGIMGAAPVSRIVRGVTIATKDEPYVKAAEWAGLSRGYVVARHLLPRLTGPILVQLALFAAIALGVQAGLAFLGMGIEPPAPSWGGGIAEAQQVLFRTQWLFVAYGVPLALTALAFGMLGDAARDAWVEVWSPGERKIRRHPSGRRDAPVRLGQATTSAEDAALLSVRDLKVRYEGQDRLAVADVSFDLGRGEVLGIVGESGSGKSTVMLSLLSLLPGNGHVESGTATLDGEDLLGMSPGRLREIRGRRIAWISQDPMSSLDPVFTVGTIMNEIVGRYVTTGNADVKARTLELLELVRLPEPDVVYGKYAFELSGGMAQRVCIALSLAGDPDVLIADEPTTALDVTVQAAILDLLRSLSESLGVAIVVVTHNLGVVADLCQRALVMRDGVIVESGDCESILLRPQHPYTVELVASTLSLAVDERDPSRVHDAAAQHGRPVSERVGK